MIYTNGRPDELNVQSVIRAGDRSRPLDLQGRERSIDRVELSYRTIVNPVDVIQGQGRLRHSRVCVEGLQ